jgi:hypothetical protein
MESAPTGLIVALKFVCRGGVSPPDKFMQKREAERLPYGQNIKIRTHFVGDDILGVPFARCNLTKSLLQWEKVPRNEADEV